ncbi:helix-turn-helix transcriptional regulator [Chromobacterium alkanivorans]|uniref:helix-turn-helix transcriptional regulator n=1 Tax=Chromobacterium alkanivorans TaxID=1071719 RepID=UPI0019675A87|nr:AraC family transcriptional regulator [Chromobacterium alkanivorans]MBN3006278.1 helix-turn-helix transcriptional regulator [Chromobacterium alkanivorans]
MDHIFQADDHLLVIGQRIHAEPHTHHYAHLMLCLEPDPARTLRVRIGSDAVACRGLLLDGGVEHAFYGKDGLHALLLIDHTSRLWRELKARHLPARQTYAVLPEPLTRALAARFAAMTAAACRSCYHSHWRGVLKQLGLDPRLAGHAPSDGRLRGVLARIRRSPADERSIRHLARQIHLSPSRLSHLFKQQTGGTLKHYLLFQQLLDALGAVAQHNSVSAAALDAGFDTPSHLSATCRRLIGIPPSMVRNVSGFLKAPKPVPS